MSVHGENFFRSLRHAFVNALPLSILFGVVAAFCIGHSWQLVSSPLAGGVMEGFARISSAF